MEILPIHNITIQLFKILKRSLEVMTLIPLHLLMMELKERKELLSHLRMEQDMKENGAKKLIKETVKDYKPGQTGLFMKDIGEMIKLTVVVD
jgi:hypothetical protein